MGKGIFGFQYGGNFDESKVSQLFSICGWFLILKAEMVDTRDKIPGYAFQISLVRLNCNRVREFLLTRLTLAPILIIPVCNLVSSSPIGE